ncbi:hypothetical protein ACT453_09535, partial [Bacillus sp. D-CC]
SSFCKSLYFLITSIPVSPEKYCFAILSKVSPSFTVCVTTFSGETGIEVIKKYNDLQKDEVNVGQELKIPIKGKSTKRES